jgi:hypothetical protein
VVVDVAAKAQAKAAKKSKVEKAQKEAVQK